METLILNSKSKSDIRLLMAIAKKLGMDLKVADKKDLILVQANLLNQSVKANRIPFSEIVDTCNTVRKEQYEKIQKNNS